MAPSEHPSEKGVSVGDMGGGQEPGLKFKGLYYETFQSCLISRCVDGTSLKCRWKRYVL